MKNRLIVLLVLVYALLGSPASAEAGKKPDSEFKSWLKVHEAEHFQQSGLKLLDPRADATLIRMLDTVPMKLLKGLVQQSYPQAEIQKEKELAATEQTQAIQEKSGKAFVIGRTKPIDIDRLTNLIRRVIQEQYPKLKPVLGEEHKWCPEARSYLLYGFWHRLGRHVFRKQKEFPSPLFLRSKLFLLLACGWTSRYAVTGLEKALAARIMKYPDRGVRLHDLFRESYLLNRGNLYLTMLTAENVLAGDPYRVDRESDPVQGKLAYIRHDSAPMGDNYGAWYHFYGIALYGLVRAPVVSRAVAEIESVGSLFLEGKDKQEDYINRLGAIFGRRLNRMIVKKSYLKPLTRADRFDYMLPISERTFPK